MSPPSGLQSDAGEITAPKDPAAYRPRPLLGVTFWAMLALMLLCVLAGVGVAEFGPRLFGSKPLARSAAEAPPAIDNSAAATAPAIASTPPLAAPPAPSADVARLNARV